GNSSGASNWLMPRQIIAANRRSARWGHVKANSDALQLRARSRIKLHNKRIMSWNDMAPVRRQCQQPVESLQHFTDMERSRKRTLTRHVLVKMADIRVEYHKSPGGAGLNT